MYCVDADFFLYGNKNKQLQHRLWILLLGELCTLYCIFLVAMCRDTLCFLFISLLKKLYLLFFFESGINACLTCSASFFSKLDLFFA